MMFGDADPVEPQFLGISGALNHASKGARARVAVVGAGRHRPLPRQIRGRVVAAGFEIRGLHLCTSPVQRVSCGYNPRARRRQAATPRPKAGAALAVWHGRRGLELPGYPFCKTLACNAGDDITSILARVAMVSLGLTLAD